MGRTKINIFGVKFAKPRGLHKSPGSNWLSSCVGYKLSGKHNGSRAAQKAAFIRAAKECQSAGKSWKP